ncbi:hypothetical protein [Pseudomonas viridiflava]|uniref:hypothetical protein n=1 Tax=Pseudomonas viridiflava TaxID=33069 RepID=UPI000F053D2F|nr:hypothetical protein [Pseudomonas viridiflava]
MTKYYFVRKVTFTLSGDRQIHLLSLVTGVLFKARLDQALMSKAVFPGMSYRAYIVKRGRGLTIASLEPSEGVGVLECKALANFLGTHDALPRYTPRSGLGKLLAEAAILERCQVRQLLQHRSQHILRKHLGEAQAAQLEYAWEDYLSFQASVTGVMAMGFDQSTAERMVSCLPAEADSVLVNPLVALPFIEPHDNLILENLIVDANPGVRVALELLRYLERESLAGNTVVKVRDLSAGVGPNVDISVGTIGTVGADFSGGSNDVFEAIRHCVYHGWIVSMESHVQLAANYRLQHAVRDHLTRICGPFHPSYSPRQIDHAFSRLSAFTPDMFTSDMVDEVALAINSRLLLVRYDNIKAAIEFSQQYCAVYELLTNIVPTSVTVAKARAAIYERELGVAHIPFYALTDRAHEQAIVVHQINQLPLFEIFQLLAGIGNVVNLVALIDTTLPTNAAVEQMLQYFSSVDVHVRQQGALPVQQCLRNISEIETRIEVEDLNRIAVICDCPEISLLLNRRYCSIPTETKVPKKGDLIRLSPRGFRREDDALIRIVNVRSNDLLVSQSHTLRTINADEFAGYSWDAGFTLSPKGAIGVALPPVLVFTSADGGVENSLKGPEFVRNLQIQGVRVIEHCVYAIEGFPKIAPLETIQRVVPLVE